MSTDIATDEAAVVATPLVTNETVHLGENEAGVVIIPETVSIGSQDEVVVATSSGNDVDTAVSLGLDSAVDEVIASTVTDEAVNGATVVAVVEDEVGSGAVSNETIVPPAQGDVAQPSMQDTISSSSNTPLTEITGSPTPTLVANEATIVAMVEDDVQSGNVSTETIVPSAQEDIIPSSLEDTASSSSTTSIDESASPSSSSSRSSIDETVPSGIISTIPSTNQDDIIPSTVTPSVEEVTPSSTLPLTSQDDIRPPTTDVVNLDDGRPSSSSSSSSSRPGGGVLETDTPESSEPSTPTMREITVLEGETMAAVQNEVVEVAMVEDVAVVQGEGVLPAATEENVAVVNTETAVEAIVDEVVPPVAEEAAEVPAVEGNEAVVAAGDEAALPVGDNAAVPIANDPAAPVPVEGEAPPPAEQAEQAADGTAAPPQTDTTDAPTEETAPAEPEVPPEPPWVYDPTQPTTILAIPPEIVLHVFNFLPLWNIKEFSLCSKRCRYLSTRRIFKHVNISSDSLKAFQKDGPLHYIADAVVGIVIRTRYLGSATDLCTFMRECMYSSKDDEGQEMGLGVFTAVRRLKLSYGQLRYDRTSALVNTGPLESLSALDAQFIKAMVLLLRKLGFWKRIRWVDFVVKLWEDRHGVFDEPEEEGNEVKPEDKPGYLSEEDAGFLEKILDMGVDDYDGVKDMVAIAPALRDVRLVNFKPRRRVTYRRKVDIFEVLAYMGGKPDKVVLEYISAGESIDLVPASRIEEVRVQRGVEEIWVNMASFDVPGFMEEIAKRFVDLKSLLLVVTTAGGEGYLVPAKGVSGPWRRSVLQNMEKIKGLKTFMVPVRVGQEGENINTGRRKELGEVPKDIIERLSELVIYWIENGADDLEKVIFERKELEDEVDSAVGPGWICKVRWENKRPKLEWKVENVSVGNTT
ncbi:hypothetical protein TWF506_010058 [Arthrobotrys conoides]|uniref:F-box domain-containing protein n=1 Tax=Arthrobotrys conoides TaxID=74498 RepID=A0AAN8RT45_9PEZI